MPRIAAVSFDLFGTLLSYDVWEDGGDFLDRVAKDRGVPIEGIDLLARWISESVRQRSGSDFVTLEKSLETGLSRIFREKGIAQRVEPWTSALFEFWRSRPLYDDVFPALEQLRTPVCIVSNIDRAHLDAIVAATGLRTRLAFSISSEEAGAYKPHPRVFALAARKLGVAPAQVLHVGDSIVDDVIGARRAGFRSAWVNRRGTQPPPDMPPAVVVRSLAEIPALVARS